MSQGADLAVGGVIPGGSVVMGEDGREEDENGQAQHHRKDPDCERLVDRAVHAGVGGPSADAPEASLTSIRARRYGVNFRGWSPAG